MDRKKLLFMRFAMGGANFLANIVGVAFVQVLGTRVERPLPDFLQQNALVSVLDTLFSPMAFVFMAIATIVYEKPIRAHLDATLHHRPVADRLAEQARRRLLNEPYVTMALDLGMWGLAALLFGAAYWQAGAGPTAVQRAVFNSLSVGLIAVIVAFFLQENVLRKHLAPFFFPAGGLSAVPGARRIRITTRLAGLLLAGNLLPLLSILMLFFRIRDMHPDPHTAIGIMGASILAYSVVFIATGVVLTIVVGRNLTLPLAQITDVLHEIRGGRFDKKVRVTTNDEIGYTGDAINEMVDGLRERERMRQALSLAMEVQQNLLPKSTPDIAGLDIAGASVYCEETGGDYFDYFEWPDSGSSAFGVAVADVAEHGVPSAMLMTTVRAFLRQRLSLRDGLGKVITDVNRQLVRDIEDTGRFVTLFLAEIDPRARRLTWVNAGHDAGMVYDRRTDSFLDLTRTGLPVGVTGDGEYGEGRRDLSPGQIIAIGTDGIWEARNARSEMFGKPRLREVIRRQADASARTILDSVLQEVDAFCHPIPPDDDITLVIVKIAALPA
jgi:sigma-B regulation protein RsbU (phosphoserine phosphatase)